MSLEFGFSEFHGILQNHNLCPIEVAERTLSLLESQDTPEHHKESIRMTLSRNEKFGKRFVRKVNDNTETHGELARKIAGKVVKHTVFDGHLREKCIPVKATQN